jgi:cytochrome c-type biogenesis protein CcmH|tara:strand:+ start:1633 stop:2007 length:375 start_codon:yes stop_codon:yes gene_type:complete
MNKLFLIFWLYIFTFNISAKSANINEIEIYKNLRCLVCQGQSIADSNSEFAQTIKLVVKDKIKEGKSKEVIYEFLASKYGDWILYRPPLNKTNFLLWSIPYLVLSLGGLIILILTKKRKNTGNN